MLFANNCNTTLNGGITDIATSMVVTSATGFPAPTGSQYFYCTLADAATQTTIEIVKVTAVSGTTFTIVRGQDGTTGTIFASGAVVSLRLVRASLNDFPKLDEVNTFTQTQTFSVAPITSSLTGFIYGNGASAQTVATTAQALSLIGTVPVTSGGTGLTAVASGYIPFGSSSSSLATSSSFYWDQSNLIFNALGTANFGSGNAAGGGGTNKWVTIQGNGVSYGAGNAGNYGGILLSANANYTADARQFLITNALGVYNFAIIRSTNATTPPSLGTGGAIASGTVDFMISNTGGVSIGNTTDPGAGNLSVNNYLLVGSTTLLAGSTLYGANTAAVFAVGTTANTSTVYFNNGSYVGSITTNGSATAYNTSSDQRLKEDKGISLDTSVIDNTIIHDFEWKTDGSIGKGVFAQEAQKVNPSAVSKGTDDLDEKGFPIFPWSVDYSKYIPDLIVYCQQLKKSNQEINAKFDAYVASHP